MAAAVRFSQLIKTGSQVAMGLYAQACEDEGVLMAMGLYRPAETRAGYPTPLAFFNVHLPHRWVCSTHFDILTLLHGV